MDRTGKECGFATSFYDDSLGTVHHGAFAGTVSLSDGGGTGGECGAEVSEGSTGRGAGEGVLFLFETGTFGAAL